MADQKNEREKRRSENETSVTVDEVWDAPAAAGTRKKSRKSLKWFLWLAVPLLVLLLILPFAALRLMAGGSTFTEQKGAVIERVQELRELTTAEAYTKVIIERSDNELFGQSIGFDIPGTQRHLLAVYPGSVKAGIDFSKVKEEDMTIDEEAKIVHLKVPAPEFLGEPVIRFNDVKIYSQEGLLRNPPDINEGNEIAQEAQKMIIEEATEQGVLTMAKQNAEKALKEMYSFSDYEVEIEFKE